MKEKQKENLKNPFTEGQAKRLLYSKHACKYGDKMPKKNTHKVRTWNNPEDHYVPNPKKKKQRFSKSVKKTLTVCVGWSF